MIFDTLEYTDGTGTIQEVALSLANLAGVPANNKIKLTPRTHASSSLEISWAQPPETGLAIPFKSRCKVRVGRTSTAGAANTFTGGTIIFQGRRWDNEGSASATRISSSITLYDLLKDFEKITYAIPWNYISGGTTAAPTFSTYQFTDIVLFQAAPGTTYNPAAVYGTLTTWQQLQDIVRYAASYATGVDAVQVQLAGSGTYTPAVVGGVTQNYGVWTGGTAPEFSPCFVNWYPVKSAKLLECLTLCLRPHPDVFTDIDHSTTPPTLHFRNRASMTAATLPYASTDANGVVHVATDIKSLDELVPDKVRLWYKINSTFNGQPIISFGSDCYPDSTNSLLALDFSIDITGSTQAQTIVNFTSYAFDPTSLALWRKKVKSLNQISQGGQIPNDGSTGALALLDATINGGGGHPDGLQVVDDAGTAIDLTTYQYFTDDSVFKWMSVSGTPVSVKSANVVGTFSYTKNTGGVLNLTPKVGRHSHSMRLKLTNAPSGQYWLKQTLNPGESIPANLAQAIYTALSTLQWKLRHQIFQVAPDTTSLPLFILPGRHKVNLAGGAAAWTTMNAVPETVSIELFRVWVNKNDGSGSEWRLAASSTISCGPVNHLEPGYLVQLCNLFWNRNRSGIDAMQRLTGGASSTQVDLSNESARENSVPANADFQQHICYAPDAVDGTRSIAITNDATTGQIVVAQQKSSDGTATTSGIIPPHYSGVGAPSATTLPANSYYRKFDFYVDTTNIAASPPSLDLWICLTAGTNATSTWYSFTQCSP